MLIDCRCPNCNRTVTGHEQVAIVTETTAHERVTSCPKCRVKIKLVKGEAIAELEMHYYDLDKAYYSPV